LDENCANYIKIFKNLTALIVIERNCQNLKIRNSFMTGNTLIYGVNVRFGYLYKLCVKDFCENDKSKIESLSAL
jgi:hypothetical protein